MDQSQETEHADVVIDIVGPVCADENNECLCRKETEVCL